MKWFNAVVVFGTLIGAGYNLCEYFNGVPDPRIRESRRTIGVGAAKLLAAALFNPRS